MPRTNVVGTTAPPGSGAQRCAQAGEREHRTDSTTGTATATAAAKTRHYCRNPRCRSKLPAPVENEHQAFCTRGCFESFYRSRCLVCEKNIGTNPLTGEKRKRLDQRKFCGRRCKAEARQFPHVYAWEVPDPVKCTRSSRSAHSTGLKINLEGGRPTSYCLRGWWWGGDGVRDHSLYDRDGLTIARVVLEGDGRYHLQKPIAIPRQAWAHLEKAKRGAESFALNTGSIAEGSAMAAVITDRGIGYRLFTAGLIPSMAVQP
jgi:hypothetical protein